MSSIVSRIGLYAEKKGISIRKIEMEIGASNGTLSKAISKEKDVLSEWVALFVKKFSDVNPIWLVTGQGSMLVGESDSASFESESRLKQQIVHLEELLKMQQEKNKLLEDLVDQLKKR